MATDPRQPRPWIKWALIGSLGLNLAIFGLAAGAWVKGPPHMAMPAAGLWHYARSLPEPYRRDIGRAVRDSRRDWMPPRAALRAQRAELAAALTAEPFEPAAVADALAREVTLSGTLAARGTALLLEQITRMSAAERQTFAEALQRDRPARRGGQGRGP